MHGPYVGRTSADASALCVGYNLIWLCCPQAVQYLERSVAVVPGKKLMLMAKRDGPRVRFSLRVRM